MEYYILWLGPIPRGPSAVAPPALPPVVYARNGRLWASGLWKDGFWFGFNCSGHIGESPSKDVSEDFIVKWREEKQAESTISNTITWRRHGACVHWGFNFAVVGTGEAIMSLDNPIVYNRYYLEKPPHFTRFMIHVASFGICKWFWIFSLLTTQM